NQSIGNECQRGCARASEWVWHDLGESSSFRWKKQESLYSKKSICRLFNSPRICFVTTGINPQHTIHRPRKKNDLAVLLVLSNFPNARVPRLCYWCGHEETHPVPILPLVSSSALLIRERFIAAF